MTKSDNNADKEKKHPAKDAHSTHVEIGDRKYQDFFEKAAEVALYYGFQLIEIPAQNKGDLFLSTLGDDTEIVEKEHAQKPKAGDKLAVKPDNTAPVMRAYLEHGMQAQSQPVRLYYYTSVVRTKIAGRNHDTHIFGMEMIGSSKSVGDATIIYLTTMILKEVGLENIIIDVNSIGDKESRVPYLRELTAYYRKHINHLCANCKQRIKTNPPQLLACKSLECQVYKEKAPQSIAHLSPAAKAHFKEVLEYLDALKLTYRINPHLVRGLDYYTHTVFEITELPDELPAVAFAENATQLIATDDEKRAKRTKDEKEEAARATFTLAAGGRYDYLAKRMGSKKDVPAVGASIGIDQLLLSPHYKISAPRAVKKPKVYFIQFGFEAKLKALEVIEVLRNARIPVMHSLNKDSLGAQLGTAEKLNVPHAIIFGQKEALDSTVIVRNMLTRSQDTVKIAKLADYLKAIK